MTAPRNLEADLINDLLGRIRGLTASIDEVYR